MLPQAALVVSLFQQRISELKVVDLIKTNIMIGGLQLLVPSIKLKYIENLVNAYLYTFSDGAHTLSHVLGRKHS